MNGEKGVRVLKNLSNFNALSAYIFFVLSSITLIFSLAADDSVLAAGDKNLGMKSFLEYKHDNDYTNETRATYGASCFVADGEWHTFTLEAVGTGMKNVLLKMYHFTGEMLVTNYTVTVA